MFGIRIPDYDTYPWCEGELKGDPDIAGIGVVSAIWATTAVTIAFSWALWYNVVRFRLPCTLQLCIPSCSFTLDKVAH